MPQPYEPWPQRAAAHRWVVLGTLPVAGTLLVLALPPPYTAIILRGGAWLAAYNLALALLAPALLLAWLGLGGLWRHLTRSATLPPEDEFLLSAIAGSALMSLLGFALGSLRLLWPLAAAALVIAPCYGLLLRDRERLKAAGSRLVAWLAADDLAAGPGAPAWRRFGIGVRAAAALLIAAMALGGAAYFDAGNTDVVQFYIPYLEEVRQQHGIWLAPDRPIYLDFLTGRGNGVYLLGAVLANGLVGHAVASAFFLLLGVLARAFVAKALAGEGAIAAGRGLAALLPDLATLLLAAGILDGVSFGKYYLESALWFLALLYGSLLYVSAEGAARRALFCLLLPLAVAIPLSLPQYQAFAAGILAIAAVARAGAGGHGWERRLLLLFAAGVAACLASLALNWLYLGTPELVPFWLFQPLIDERRFQHFGSIAVQLYTNYIQGYTSSFLNLAPGGATGSVVPAALRTGALWLSAAGEVLLIAAGLAALRALVKHLSACSAVALAVLALWALRWLAATAGADSPFALGFGFHGLLLGLGAAGGVGLLASLSWRRARGGSRVSRPEHFFSLGLAAYLLLVGLFVTLVRSGSLARLMQPSAALVPAMGLVLAAMFARWLESRPQADRRGAALRALAPALLEAATALSLLLAGAAVLREAKQHPPLAALRYLAGLDGREASIAAPPNPFDKCFEIEAAVPGGSPVLDLNGYSDMAYCMFSPLLPRNKLVHQYESGFARDFRTAVFAPPEAARDYYRTHGIDYFLIEKHDIDFWGPGLSPLMRDAELERDFDLWAETRSFYILTWRGQGRGPIPAPALDAVERWRRLGLQNQGFLLGDRRISHWQALLWMGMPRPPYAWDSAIDFRSGGNSGTYLDHGWSGAESSGTWTISREAALVLDPAPGPSGDALLTVDAAAFTPEQQPALETSVAVNGTLVGHWLFVAGEPARKRTLVIPQALLGREVPLDLALRFPAGKSPRELGLSPDARQLGLLVRSVTLGAVPAPSAPAYRLGTKLDFTRGGDAAPYLGDGWLVPDASGTWSVGPAAELRLALREPPPGDGVLAITASALTGRLRPQVTATVRINGTPVGTLAFKQGEAIVEQKLAIPHALLAASGPLTLELAVADTRPPQGLDLAPDPRPLGISLRSLSLSAQ